jgi:hypothetical protein
MTRNPSLQSILRLFLFALVGIALLFPDSTIAAPGPVYLPFVNKKAQHWPPPAPGNEILNPGFESGATGWTFFVDVGDSIIDSGLAHTGLNSAQLGLYVDPADPDPEDPSFIRTASVRQKVFVPPGKPLLQFYQYAYSLENPDPDTGQCYQAEVLGDWVRVYLNFGLVDKISLCDLFNSQGWTLRQYDLTGFEGRWIELKVEYKSDSTISSDYYLDDFSFVAIP